MPYNQRCSVDACNRLAKRSTGLCRTHEAVSAPAVSADLTPDQRLAEKLDAMSPLVESFAEETLRNATKEERVVCPHCRKAHNRKRPDYRSIIALLQMLFERGFGRAAQQREAVQPITFQYILEVDGDQEVVTEWQGGRKVA